MLVDLDEVELLLCNAHHVKNLPGRKTDVADSAWLCQLLECGLLRGSFVPPPEIARLRDLTRYRTKLVQDRARETGRDVAAPDTFPTKADSARYLARVQANMDRGLWLDPRTGRVTFAEWVDQWLASNPSKRATTRARDLTVLRTHFLPTLGPIPLAAITPRTSRPRSRR